MNRTASDIPHSASHGEHQGTLQPPDFLGGWPVALASCAQGYLERPLRHLLYSDPANHEPSLKLVLDSDSGLASETRNWGLGQARIRDLKLEDQIRVTPSYPVHERQP
jgi:hypothetical protein